MYAACELDESPEAETALPEGRFLSAWQPNSPFEAIAADAEAFADVRVLPVSGLFSTPGAS